MGNRQSRRICYLTGTRAEFGLMANTLRAIRSHPSLRLQLIVTGMHLDPAAGRTIKQIKQDGWNIDAVIPWKPAGSDPALLAEQTALVTAKLARAFEKLKPDIVLVTGDRVEAFAAATAAHLSQIPLAHVHGGDRALGQVDDTLRHTITKLAHIHFPATRESAERVHNLGEDKWRIHHVGSPGLDQITRDAWPTSKLNAQFPINKHRYALVLLHPTDADEIKEQRRAQLLLRATRVIGFDQIIILHPNTDPGASGIIRAWKQAPSSILHLPSSLLFPSSLPRPAYLGLLRDAAVLVGNSSSGIIEAASFGTPVVDVGPRQQGRQRGENVTTVPFRQAAITAALKAIWNNGHSLRFPKHNIYGRGDTATRIARVLSTLPLDSRLLRKLISY